MLFVLALIFAIPTFGLSIVSLFVYHYFRVKSFRRTMEYVIVDLAFTPKFHSALIEEIKHIDAFVYAEEVGENISKKGDIVKFTVNLDGLSYSIELEREPLGKKAIISSKLIFSSMNFWETYDILENQLSSGKIPKKEYDRRIDFLNDYA